MPSIIRQSSLRHLRRRHCDRGLPAFAPPVKLYTFTIVILSQPFLFVNAFFEIFENFQKNAKIDGKIMENRQMRTCAAVSYRHKNPTSLRFP
jgi:hypothetical protein